MITTGTSATARVAGEIDIPSHTRIRREDDPSCGSTPDDSIRSNYNPSSAHLRKILSPNGLRTPFFRISMRKLAPISHAAYELTARNSREMCGMSVSMGPPPGLLEKLPKLAVK